jgi:hypothetical protein
MKPSFRLRLLKSLKRNVINTNPMAMAKKSRRFSADLKETCCILINIQGERVMRFLPVIAVNSERNKF